MNGWRMREVANESRFRNANEAIEAASDMAGHRAMETYICECSDSGCTAAISLSRHEYEEVRAISTHFAIAIDHENPEFDCLIVEHDRYATVAKLPGDAARFAHDSDPRRQAFTPPDERRSSPPNA